MQIVRTLSGEEITMYGFSIIFVTEVTLGKERVG